MHSARGIRLVEPRPVGVVRQSFGIAIHQPCLERGSGATRFDLL